MIFKIKWGDMQRIIKKHFSPDNPNPTPLFYYEGAESIKVYQTVSNHILCAEVVKASVKVENFKMEFLSNAIELVEDYSYSPKITLAIKQE